MFKLRLYIHLSSKNILPFVRSLYSSKKLTTLFFFVCFYKNLYPKLKNLIFKNNLLILDLIFCACLFSFGDSVFQKAIENSVVTFSYR